MFAKRSGTGIPDTTNMSIGRRLLCNAIQLILYLFFGILSSVFLKFLQFFLICCILFDKCEFMGISVIGKTDFIADGYKLIMMQNRKIGSIFFSIIRKRKGFFRPVQSITFFLLMIHNSNQKKCFEIFFFWMSRSVNCIFFKADCKQILGSFQC